MKKISIVLTALLLTTQCWAADIKVIQPSGKNTLPERIAKVATTQFDEHGIKYVYDPGVPGTCKSTIDLWDAAEKDPVVLVYSAHTMRMSFAKNAPCLPQDNFKTAKVYFNARSPFWLCGTSSSKPLTAPNVKVGYLQVMPMNDIIKDINQTNNFTWSGVPSKIVSEVVLMTINGDVDYGFVTPGTIRSAMMTNKNIVCVGSGRSNDIFPDLLTKVKMTGDASAILYYPTIVVAKNLTPEQEKLVFNAYNNNRVEYQNFIIREDLYMSPLPRTGKDYVYITDWINRIKKVAEQYKK